jgi:hypothetical protein
VPDIVRMMDLQQEQLARSMGEGHRVIHGVAGSGKTMILGCRAQYLAQAIAKQRRKKLGTLTISVGGLRWAPYGGKARRRNWVEANSWFLAKG